MLCRANGFCCNLAAWAFGIAGRAIEPTICCFDCLDELAARAAALDLPINVERVQPDTCYTCSGHLVGDDRRYVRRGAPRAGEPRPYVAEVGPFCSAGCAERWIATPRGLEGRS